MFQPFVREMTTAGKFVREFTTPSIYNYVDNTTTGGRSNKIFEALTVAPNGTVYTANEDALIQDGPITTVQAGSVVRVTAMDPATGTAKAQYAYQLPKIPVDAPAGARFPPDNGLSDFLAIGNKKFIAVERAFADGIGNTIRLVLTEITDATTDVSRIAKLTDTPYTPMTRKMLLEMPINYQGIKLDNIEAITWGKTLPNGNRTIVLAADNNFTADTQANQFIVFEVLPHDTLDGLERQHDDGSLRVVRGGGEDHEHGLPPGLDVVDARQHHLAEAADDEVADLHRLRRRCGRVWQQQTET
jgi:hypothetical protein